jgi:hypothetical protein
MTKGSIEREDSGRHVLIGVMLTKVSIPHLV